MIPRTKKIFVPKIRHSNSIGSLIMTRLTGALLVIALAFCGLSTVNAQEPMVIPPRLFIVTGGQTGVDRAALDTALALFLPVRGWCPQGRLAEDGRISSIYPLQETNSEDVAVRTEWNVRDSNGTLILAFSELAGGTLLTKQLANQYHRPSLVINALTFNPKDEIEFDRWIKANQIRILNIAGPRESSNPGVIYTHAYKILHQLLEPFDQPTLSQTI